jgi:integrase/recombinase XerD
VHGSGVNKYAGLLITFLRCYAFEAALANGYNVTLKKHWPLDEAIPMPKMPFTLPAVLREVLHFLDSVEHLKHRTILTACYAAGLRVSEVPIPGPRRMDRKAAKRT